MKHLPATLPLKKLMYVFDMYSTSMDTKYQVQIVRWQVKLAPEVHAPRAGNIPFLKTEKGSVGRLLLYKYRICSTTKPMWIFPQRLDEALGSCAELNSCECPNPDETHIEDVDRRLQSITQDFKLAENFFESGSKCVGEKLDATDLRLSQFIGEGSFGNVLQARAKSRRTYALKVLDRDDPRSLNELQVPSLLTS